MKRNTKRGRRTFRATEMIRKPFRVTLSVRQEREVHITSHALRKTRERREDTGDQ